MAWISGLALLRLSLRLLAHAKMCMDMSMRGLQVQPDADVTPDVARADIERWSTQLEVPVVYDAYPPKEPKAKGTRGEAHGSTTEWLWLPRDELACRHASNRRSAQKSFITGSCQAWADSCCWWWWTVHALQCLCRLASASHPSACCPPAGKKAAAAGKATAGGHMAGAMRRAELS